MWMVIQEIYRWNEIVDNLPYIWLAPEVLFGWQWAIYNIFTICTYVPRCPSSTFCGREGSAKLGWLSNLNRPVFLWFLSNLFLWNPSMFPLPFLRCLNQIPLHQKGVSTRSLGLSSMRKWWWWPAEDELSFGKHQILKVLNKENDINWYRAELDGQEWL